MITVGLTGGIGAGKSEVARLLASHGALVIDADALAREALAPGTPELVRVVEEFGSAVLRPDGSLDRGRLGRLVFADPKLLTVLNGIVHPYVARRSAELMAQAPADVVVVHDVPLLAESKLQGAYDVVVVVDAPPETQVARLVAGRGMTEEDARARMSAQATREQRRAIADAVIDNDGTLPSLERQVRDLWSRLVGNQQAIGGQALD